MRTFWLEEWVGTAKGGYFYRSDLFKAFQKFEEHGLKIVGIKIQDDFNIEFIVEEKSES